MSIVNASVTGFITASFLLLIAGRVVLLPALSFATVVTFWPNSLLSLEIVTAPVDASTVMLVSVVVHLFPSFVTIEVIGSVCPLGT